MRGQFSVRRLHEARAAGVIAEARAKVALDQVAAKLGNKAGAFAYSCKDALEDEVVREYALIYGIMIVASVLEIIAKRAGRRARENSGNTRPRHRVEPQTSEVPSHQESAEETTGPE